MRLSFTPRYSIFASITTGIALTLSLLTGCKKDDESDMDPIVDPIYPVGLLTFSPSQALVGDTITLTGENFNPDITQNITLFGEKAAKIVAATPTELKVIVPDGAVSSKIGVRSGEKVSVSATDFGVFNFYMIGYRNNGDEDIIITYWKNGVPATLSGQNPSAAYITGANNSFYMAGSQYNGTHYIATYWKDGKPFALTDGKTNAFASTIAVYNGDLYVTGSADIEGERKAVYWKNDQMVVLENTGKSLSAGQIVVVNNDVYIAGTQLLPSEDPQQSRYIATYWINGKEFMVEDGGLASFGGAMAVSNNIAYMAGSDRYMGRPGAVYWKNGEVVRLTESATNYVAQANDIQVVNNDVYVAGWAASYLFDGREMAICWKNGEPMYLGDKNTHSNANTLTLFNGHVYVTGYEGDAYAAVGWKDGKKIKLTQDNNTDIWINGTAIAP